MAQLTSNLKRICRFYVTVCGRLSENVCRDLTNRDLTNVSKRLPPPEEEAPATRGRFDFKKYSPILAV